MKLGLVTYNVARDWDVATILKNCKAAGIEGVEPRTTHAHGIEPSLAPERRREVRKQFEDAGVALWGLGSVCEFHSPDPEVVKKLETEGMITPPAPTPGRKQELRGLSRMLGLPE